MGNHQIGKWGFMLLLVVTVCLSGCGGEGEVEGEIEAKPAEETQSVAKVIKTPAQVFQTLLQEAQPPEVLGVHVSNSKYKSEEFYFMMLGDSTMKGLNGSEWLMAFADPVHIPKLDLVENPDGFFMKACGIFPRGYNSATRDRPVYFAELSKFKDYYDSFLESNTTPLRRQASIGEFRISLLGALAEYKAMVKSVKEKTYLLTLDGYKGFVAMEIHYDVPGGKMILPLDVSRPNPDPKARSGEVGILYQLGSRYCGFKGTKSIANYGQIKNLEMPMDIDAAEAFIAATAKMPAKMEIIVRPTGPVTSSQSSGIGLAVLGIRMTYPVGEETKELAWVF